MKPRDIARQLSQQRQQKQDAQPWYRAEIVEQRNSTGEDTIEVENRPYFVWVRLWSAQGNVVPAYNVRVAAVAGLAVWVSRSPMPGSEGDLEIMGLDREILEAQNVAPNAGLTHRQHAASHEWPDADPGLDAVTVYPRSWAQLRTYAQDPLSLSVNVSPLVYAYGNAMVTFDGGVMDLTAVEATLAVGEARLALVYLDLATNALAYTMGAIGADAGGWALDDPAVSNDTFPSAVVRIAEAQTENSESDIRDRRMFLNGSPGAIGGWPFDTAILTVDTTDADADYATVAAAIAAPPAVDNTILVSPEQHVCENQVLPGDVNMLGWDWENCQLLAIAQVIALTLSGNSDIGRLYIENNQNNAAAIAGVFVNGNSCELWEIFAVADNAGAGNGYGIEVGNTREVDIIQCRAGGYSGGGNGYGVYVADAGSATVHIRDGWFEGDTADIFIGSGSTLYLYGPRLENGTIAGTGTVQGWYYDVNGALFVINDDVQIASGFDIDPADASGQDLGDATHRWDLYTQDVIFGGATGTNITTIPDNLADALHVIDAGGLEYQRFITTDAGPLVAFDPAGAGGMKVGISTITVPHGGIGRAMVALDGPQNSVAGPHIQITTDEDNYPVFQMYVVQHDSFWWAWDCYFDGAHRSSDAGSNFRLVKDSDELTIEYDSGIAQGAVITWNPLLACFATGRVGVNTAIANYEFDVEGNIGLRGGAANADRYIYFATDAYIFWDEANDLFTLPKALRILMVQPNLDLTWTNTASYGRFRFREGALTYGTVQSMGSTFAVAARQRDTEFFSVADITFWPGNASTYNMTTAAFYPTNVKATDLGLATNEWDNIYYVTVNVGTSRLVRATRDCPVCGTELSRGTGTTIYRGETADYAMCFCLNCGNAAVEELNHLSPEKELKKRPPPKIVLESVRVKSAGRNRSVAIDFRYGDDIVENGLMMMRAIRNSTRLGEYEVDEFLAMDEAERLAFLLVLGEREWASREEARLMREEADVLRSVVKAKTNMWVGTDLLKREKG